MRKPSRFSVLAFTIIIIHVCVEKKTGKNVCQLWYNFFNFSSFAILEAAFNIVHLLSLAYIPYNISLLLSGILAQNTGLFMNKTFGPTYIAASYIKYIESAGGRVVPIKYPLKKVKFSKFFPKI